MDERPLFEEVGEKKELTYFSMCQNVLHLSSSSNSYIKPFKTLCNEEGLVLMLAVLKNCKVHLCLLKPLPTKKALV